MQSKLTLGDLLSWLDNHLLYGLCLFLLAFIPLYPKIPLFDALPGYIVKVRIEDFLVVLTGIVWLKDVIKKRVTWNIGYFWFILMYAIVGLTSIAAGILLMQTIPMEMLHIGKSGLHWLRYMEYFSLFFFLFGAIRSKKQVYLAFGVVIVTLLGVVAFGIGQQYAHFPVFSTMNREYSKGEMLYLQPGARPQSTFAGHYDLAAYLSIILPLVFAMSLGGIKSKSTTRQFLWFGGLQLVHLAGLIMLVLSSSKTAIAGYGVGLIVVMLLFWLRLASSKQKAMWGGAFVVLGLLACGLFWFLAPAKIKMEVTRLAGKLQGSAITQGVPVDLQGDGYEDKTVSTAQPDGTTKLTTIRVKSQWSANALKYGISMGIRLDTLWPEALLGLARNLITGSGYGTLAMMGTSAFREADSTDNNFLRTIGETGILGFITFYAIILLIIKDTWTLSKSEEPLEKSLSIGFLGALVGILISAATLDVFAASKVAFTFWALAGLIIKSGSLGKVHELSVTYFLSPIHQLLNHIKRHWPLYITLLVAAFLLHQNPFMTNNPTKDIANFTSGLEQLTRARCYIRLGTFSLCRNEGLSFGGTTAIYAALLVPILRTFYTFDAYTYLNLALIVMATWISYRLIRQRTGTVITFTVLMVPIFAASLLHLTQAPLSNRAFFAVLIAWPLGCGAVAATLDSLQWTVTKRLKWGLLVLTLAGVGVVTWRSNPAIRYRSIDPNLQWHAVETANITLTTTPSAYLISTLNPYYVDLYSTNNYHLLPLSPQQPYANNLPQVWGVPAAASLEAAYNALLANRDPLYISDFGTNNPNYQARFLSLKATYDLHYKALGCEEQCNIYSVSPAKPKVSINPRSDWDNKTLDLSKLGDDYQFAVVSNRFDSNLDTGMPHAFTPVLAAKLNAAKIKTNYMFLTGDGGDKGEESLVDLFGSLFAAKAPYPVFYAPGNYDLIPQKYPLQAIPPSFFTPTEYTIALNVDAKSHFTPAEQMRLYDAFLDLEKLPHARTLFIIAHDLNWQDKSDPTNAIHTIEKKLQQFPQLTAYVITANHSPKLLASDNWYETKTGDNGKLVYVASLVAETKKDVYIQVNVHHGEVTLNPVSLP